MMITAGAILDLKMSYQYMDPDVENKTVFNMGIPIPGKDDLYIKTGPWAHKFIKKRPHL